MEPVTILKIALASLDWAISRADAAGEDIPQAHIDNRTELRRELARQSQNESS